MKKIHLIIACVFYSLHALAQQEEIMQLTLPKGAEKLNEKQLMAVSHDNFNENSAADFHAHIYKKDGILIYYHYFGVPKKMEKPLENTQMQMVYIIKHIPNTVVDKSKIIEVKGIRFLIIEYHENDNKYFKFISDFDQNSRQINGSIEYKEPDEDKARQYLQDLLQSLYFKS
jgi:hypothetical protein